MQEVQTIELISMTPEWKRLAGQILFWLEKALICVPVLNNDATWLVRAMGLLLLLIIFFHVMAEFDLVKNYISMDQYRFYLSRACSFFISVIYLTSGAKLRNQVSLVYLLTHASAFLALDILKLIGTHKLEGKKQNEKIVAGTRQATGQQELERKLAANQNNSQKKEPENGRNHNNKQEKSESHKQDADLKTEDFYELIMLRIISLEAQMEELLGQVALHISSLEARMAELEKQIALRISSLEERIVELEEDSVELKCNLENITNTVNSLINAKKKNDLNAQIEKYQSEIKELTAQLQTAQASADHFKALYANSEYAYHMLREQYNDVASKAYGEKISVSHYRRVADELDDKCRKFEEERSKLSASLCSARAQADIYRGLLVNA